MQFSTMPSKGW